MTKSQSLFLLSIFLFQFQATTNHIYVTDLGNNYVLDTDTKLWVTKKLSLSEGRNMKNLMGVEIDPSENIIGKLNF